MYRRRGEGGMLAQVWDVEAGGKGIIFLAQSEARKSTHAKYNANREESG